MSFTDDARDQGDSGMNNLDNVHLAERLREVCAELGAPELRAVVRFAEKVRAGRRRYGELRLDTDGRDFITEAVQEAFDMAAYLSFELQKRGA